MNFVKLTGWEDNGSPWCNLDNVKVMDISGQGFTCLFFGDGDTVNVRESPEEILERAAKRRHE